jgi:hypothetical protein
MTLCGNVPLSRGKGCDSVQHYDKNGFLRDPETSNTRCRLLSPRA